MQFSHSKGSRRLVHSRHISYFPETMKKDENNDEVIKNKKKNDYLHSIIGLLCLF